MLRDTRNLKTLNAKINYIGAAYGECTERVQILVDKIGDKKKSNKIIL